MAEWVAALVLLGATTVAAVSAASAQKRKCQQNREDSPWESAVPVLYLIGAVNFLGGAVLSWQGSSAAAVSVGVGGVLASAIAYALSMRHCGTK